MNAELQDPDGNLLSITGSPSYTYDSRNRLLQHDGVTYTYDPANTLVGWTDSDGPTTFTVAPDHGLSKVLTKTTNGQTTNHVYGLGLLYEVDAAEETRTYHYDFRGSTVALTDDTGTTATDRIEYASYGRITNRTGITATPFLFNGKYGVLTAENNLLSMRARHYSPTLRRFINQDPIQFGGGMNQYAYADGNPVSLIDPFGLDALFLYVVNDTGASDTDFSEDTLLRNSVVITPFLRRRAGGRFCRKV